MQEMKKAIGKKIQDLREFHGWTQDELAQRTGHACSRTYVGQLEKGLKEPSARILKALAEAFRVPIASFFDESDQLPLIALEDHFPEDARQFLKSRDYLPYIKLAVKAKDLELTPEILEQLIEVTRQAQKLSKCLS